MSNQTKDRGALRRRRALALNPTTRAVRAALALGLAVAAATPAFAGSCDVSDPANASCDGVFTGTGIAYAIEDLSLVVGGVLPTTIDPSAGIAGIDLSSYAGSITLASYADIHAYNAYGNAAGITTRSYYGDISIVDDGLVDVAVTGYGNATAVNASNFFGSNEVVVGADGEVYASTDNVYGGRATGVRAGSYLGGSSVTNYGDIGASAIAEYGDATAYGVLDRGGYYGITSVLNEGEVHAYASTGDGVGWAWGIRERGRYAELTNEGDVSAIGRAYTGYASATASYVRGSYASTSNGVGGELIAYAQVDTSGQALAYGAMTWGYLDSSIDNQGNIEAHASTGQGTAVAMGTSSHYDHVSAAGNSGSILAEGYSGLGFVESVGVYNYALDVSTVDNGAAGTITALAEVGNGYAFAYGAWLDAGELSTLANDGLIHADAQVDASGAFQQGGGMARSIGASIKARYADAYLDNADGALIEASSEVYGEYGRAYAFGAVVQGANIAHLANEGTISAQAYSVAGYAISLGDIAYGTFAVNLNYGTVSASSVVAGAGYAQAIGQYAFGQVSTVVNEGTVSASADVYSGAAVATGAMLYGAYVAGYNYGDITADAHAVVGDAGAYGIAAYGAYGSSVYNLADATIAASASVVAGNAVAQGINNEGYVYGAYVDNAGQVSASAASAYGNATAVGVVNVAYLYGLASTQNSGDILASASSGDAGAAEAIGVYQYAFVYGGMRVSNSGTIAATASGQGYASATGIAGVFYDGYALVDNSGGIQAEAVSFGGEYGAAEAVGVGMDTLLGKYNLPDVAISNTGSIDASATRYGAYGYASASGVAVSAMSAEFYNSGSIDALARGEGDYSGAHAVGAQLFGKYATYALNEGSVQAQALSSHGGSASAIGLLGTAYYGDATLRNDGDIAASANAAFDGSAAGNAYALGALLHGDYVVEGINTGAIVASASADYGSATARGFVASSKYDVAALDNAGDIVAVAAATDGYATAQAVRVSSKYGASVANDGDIEALAYADGGVAAATGLFVQAPGAHGYFYGAIGAVLYNGGEIHALALAGEGMASAVGARVEGAQDAGAYSHNDGLVDAEASGASAYALGVSTWSYYGDVALANAGDIVAVATAGDAGAAIATATLTRAQGFGPPGYPAGAASVYNSGNIVATASSGDAGSASAFAVVVLGEQGASLSNYGSIVASATGGDAVATAVTLDSGGVDSLRNYGEILATGNGAAHIAVSSGANAIAAIENYGSIAGSILTGNLDDSLSNHAGATLLLRDDRIDLGAYSGEGNRFDNEGRIVVRGDGNRIDMGQGLYTLVPSLNPLAFVNDGIVDFHDGAADDVLLLVGDLAGNGRLEMDADGASTSGDLLYVDGSVADGSVQAIDVWFDGVPTAASTSIALVRVSGDSAAGEFVLGDVHTGLAPNFLDLGFGLAADIDAGNARADEFSLQVEVLGLSDAGTLAASVAPAAQSLMSAQVGTWRQRMGQIDAARKGGVALWARVFRSKGAIAPAHSASNFGQGGNFAFDQRNAGAEAGLDFAVTDELSLGLLLAKAEADQHLQGPGAGAGRIEGDSVGAYGTWISPNGLYLDGSWRRMRFDLDSGALHGDGHAESFNLEAGYAWTLSDGVRMEPQVQLTRTRVDGIDALTLGATQMRVAAGTSSLGRVGLTLSKHFDGGADAWSWTPYGGLSAIHEFDGDNRYAINGNFFGATSTRGTSALLEAGFSAERGPLSVSAGINWQDGGALQSFLGGQFNLSYRW